jgi:hypothetical protein
MTSTTDVLKLALKALLDLPKKQRIEHNIVSILAAAIEVDGFTVEQICCVAKLLNRNYAPKIYTPKELSTKDLTKLTNEFNEKLEVKKGIIIISF